MSVAFTEADICELIEAEIERAGGLRALAREWRISPSYLCHVIGGRTKPGDGILRHLGLVKVVAYQVAGRSVVG